MKQVYLDSAATTRCCSEAASALQRFAETDYGNPSSTHAMGAKASQAIKESRRYFADLFKVAPDQIIFTASGSESDNLAIYGVAMDRLSKCEPFRVLASSTEHPAVKKSVQSLLTISEDVEVEAEFIPVKSDGQIDEAKLLELLKKPTTLVTFHQVNNIVGTRIPVEKLAKLIKQHSPQTLVHVDAVQAFGKVPHPLGPDVDLVSISGHKIEGPKGVGALIILNPSLMKSGIRPLIWGGGQEGGFRSGTQSPGLIYGFYLATKRRFENLEAYTQKIASLHSSLKESIQTELGTRVHWNSPRDAIPHIVSLSIPGYSLSQSIAGPLAKLLEERGFLVSTGSACSSSKPEPEPVLAAMGFEPGLLTSMVRVSFSDNVSIEDTRAFSRALRESLDIVEKLLGPPARK